MRGDSMTFSVYYCSVRAACSSSIECVITVLTNQNKNWQLIDVVLVIFFEAVSYRWLLNHLCELNFQKAPFDS